MVMKRLGVLAVATLVQPLSSHAQTNVQPQQALGAEESIASKAIPGHGFETINPGISSQPCYTIDEILQSKSTCKPSNHSKTASLSNFEQALQTAAIYTGRLLPRLNNSNGHHEIQNQLLNDGQSLIISLATDYANSKLQSIPFFAQTQLGVAVNSSADTTYHLNSLIKLAELGRDEDGLPQGLVFAQGKITGTSSSRITTNAGVGLRKRLNDTTMVGANGFWDYRMTPYSSSYSRWGLGAEVWWNDFKLTNNWYIAGTGIKRITTSGDAYVDEATLNAGETYAFDDWAGANTYDERVVPGWDVGLTYRLPNYPQLALGLRGYRWDYLRRHDNTGVEGSINWQATPHLNVGAWVSNEIPAYPTLSNSALNQQGSTFVGLRFNYNLQPVHYTNSSDRIKNNLITQMSQPVNRRYDVLLERWKPDLNKTVESSFGNRAAGL